MLFTFITKVLLRILRKLLKILEEEKRNNLFPHSPLINIADDFKIEPFCFVQIRTQNVRINISSHVYFRQFCNILLQGDACLEIGKNVFFNNYCSINCLNNIIIGDNTLFGEGVKIYDHNHKFSLEDTLIVERDEFTTAPVRIGKNCWIGSNVTILKGVEIGDNVIIGANNLIYKSIKSNTVVKSKADYIFHKKVAN